MKEKEEKSFLKKTFIAIDWLLDKAMILCVMLAVTITVAGLILNYGFIGGLIIILVVLGTAIAVVWTIRSFIRGLTGSNKN